MTIKHIISSSFDRMLNRINGLLKRGKLPASVLRKALREAAYVSGWTLDVNPVTKTLVVKGDDNEQIAPDEFYIGAGLETALCLDITSAAAEYFGGEDALAAHVVAANYGAFLERERRRYAARKSLCDRVERERYQEDKEKGNPRRLSFLWDLFWRLGYRSEIQIAQVCGMKSQQNLHYYRVKDDMELSRLQRMLQKVGIIAIPSFEKQQLKPAVTSRMPGDTVVRYHFVLPQPRSRNRINETLRRVAENGRLSLVAREIVNSGLPLRGFCMLHSLNYQNTLNALKADDMKVSAIEAFARALGLKVRWDIYKE